MLLFITALRGNSFIDDYNVFCMLKRRKLKGNGTYGDSTEITFNTPISSQIFQCFAIPDISSPSSSKQKYATPSSLPLYFVVGKRKLRNDHYMWETSVFLKYGSVIKKKFSQACLDRWIFQEVNVTSEYCEFTVKQLNYIGQVIITINGL